MRFLRLVAGYIDLHLVLKGAIGDLVLLLLLASLRLNDIFVPIWIGAAVIAVFAQLPLFTRLYDLRRFDRDRKIRLTYFIVNELVVAAFIGVYLGVAVRL